MVKFNWKNIEIRSKSWSPIWFSSPDSNWTQINDQIRNGLESELSTIWFVGPHRLSLEFDSCCFWKLLHLIKSYGKFKNEINPIKKHSEPLLPSIKLLKTCLFTLEIFYFFVTFFFSITYFNFFSLNCILNVYFAKR